MVQTMCVRFGESQIILEISGWSVKNKFVMIFDTLANIFPV